MTRIERATATRAFQLGAALDQPAVAFAQEGVGLGGGRGGLPEHALQVRVALAGLARAAPGPRLDGAWRELGPGDQLTGGRELGHVKPELGDDRLGGADADAGDLVEPGERGERARLAVWGAGARFSGFLGGGDRRDERIDAHGERVDLDGQRIDLIEQHRCELGVVLVEAARQRLDECGAA